MTQEAHTQEPWRFVPWHIEEGPSAVRASDGHLICSTASDANARRIVACVNALAGIPIEAIESGVIAELVEAAKAIERYLRETPHHNATQAAALRAALNRLEASK